MTNPNPTPTSSSPAAHRLRATLATTATPTLLQAMRQVDTTTEEGRIVYAMTGAHLAHRLDLDPQTVATSNDPIGALESAAASHPGRPAGRRTPDATSGQIG